MVLGARQDRSTVDAAALTAHCASHAREHPFGPIDPSTAVKTWTAIHE
jgi:hypothetical protein